MGCGRRDPSSTIAGQPVQIDAMNAREFQLQGLADPRLAVHATSPLPAWLWSIDGTRVLWANAVGATLLGAANAGMLVGKTFGPADGHRRQVAQLAGRLSPTGAVRLERLRGFGASFGMLMTCSCARLDFADGRNGILIAAAEPAPRTLPLTERLRGLVEGFETPVAAFARDGMLAGASGAARQLPGVRELAGRDFDKAREDALKDGRSELLIDGGRVVLHRIGSDNDVGFVAMITPDPPPAPEVAQTEAPLPPQVTLHAASAGFALVGEFAEPLEEGTPAQVERLQGLEQSQTGAVKADTTMSVDPPPNEPAPPPRRHPLRFTWQMDADGRFSLGVDEFTRLIGTRTTAGFGRPWQEISEEFGLDPAGRVVEAMATRDAWSGVTVYWPVDGGGRLPVELSGLPIHDSMQNFAGYRGFGVCRDLDSLAHLAELRRLEPLPDLPAPFVPTDAEHAAAAAHRPAAEDVSSDAPAGSPASIADETSPQADLDEPAEPLGNVVPFPLPGDARSPALTPAEDGAFNELARRLSARLDSENGGTPEAGVTSPIPTSQVSTNQVSTSQISTSQVSETPVAPPAHEAQREAMVDPAPSNQPDWLRRPEPPAHGETRRDRTLLDLLPSGVLIYRLDRLLYANTAFLERLGYDSLHALEHAGGLDALYVDPGVSPASSTSEAGTPVTISAGDGAARPSAPTEARLYTISWDGESALALMLSANPAAPDAPVAVAPPQATTTPAPVSPPQEAGHAHAEDLGAILDTTSDGIVMFDAEGNIQACNRSAELLFGYEGNALVRRNLADLFAPESQRVVMDYFESIKSVGQADLSGRDVQARSISGEATPLSVIIGRTRSEGPNFFAMFRDQAQNKRSENEVQQARRLAERAANAKADMVARISHEVRAPLNAIIGFSEVMIGEWLGSLGNERYVEYLKDIRASGERVIAMLNDLSELARIETGKLDLAFTNQNLNELVESCVTVMQPQASRERIIIRTSLAQALPPVVADGRTLRQITLNLIGNSIHLANPAGQVIVSTALSDFGEVVLRVRDSGHGLNDNEVAAALEPFRTPPPSDETSEASPVNLSLTKALVEANRAKFHIKTGGRGGTLIEVVFPHAVTRG
jgi:PAS domain S-box-containing protein